MNIIFLIFLTSYCFVNLIDNDILPEDSLTSIDGSQSNTAETMQVVVLTCQQKVADLCDDGNLLQRDVLVILTEATDAALFHTIEIADGKRRGGVDGLDAITEAWMHLLNLLQ